MPDTAVNAPTANLSQQDANETTPRADGKTQVREVEFPSAPQSAAATGTGQLDILLDMDIPV